MTELFERPDQGRPEIERDGKGRPLVWLPDGSKRTAYTRCTTYVGCLEDQYAVHLWQQRMVALGLADRPDLLVSVAAHRDDREVLNSLVEAAREAARGNAAARTGTALHALTEQHDRGQSPLVPPAWRADIAAYIEATRAITWHDIEQFCVQDDLKVAGTPDGIAEFDGRFYIADKKTGTIDFGHLKFAMQFAMYGHSAPYNIATHDRGQWPEPLDLERAILIHLPQGEGRCDLYWVNIAAGWDAVQIARAVRAWRNKKGLLVPFGTEGPPSMRQIAMRDGGIDPGTLRMLIRTTATADGVRELYREAVASGVDGESIVTECKRRVAQLT